MRKTVIAGNWKMNLGPAKTVELIDGIKTELAGKKTDGCEIIVCVPFVDLAAAVKACEGTPIKVGAQNIHWAEKGAFTGEISGDMLKEVGAEYVIVGHSERRQYFGETDVTVNKRLTAALNCGLKVILCVGELLEQREGNITGEIVSMQTKIALSGISAEQMKNIIIAYEPVWAIGTGKTATSDQADETNGVIRDVVRGLYGDEVAENTTVQYGGSMNAGNAQELLSKTNVDGGLIGGASLKSHDFSVIIAAAQ